MRVKDIFTLFPRKLASGRRVFYYQCYDEKGKRQNGKSTGLCKRTEAMAYCMKLYKDGLLIPEKKAPTFAEFSAGWWDTDTCRYLKWRQLRDPISQSSMYIYRKNFENHIKDYFAQYKLNEIDASDIESWLLWLNDKGLKATTVNLAFFTLKIMIGEAVRTKALKYNPCLEVKKLRAQDAGREILTIEEVRKLFIRDWYSVWDSKVVYLAHRLAACTGLRIGELMGLRGEYVFDDYIHIAGQYNRYGYIGHTKTKHDRSIPITSMMREELEDLLQANGKGYVFSDNGGETPVPINRISREFYRVLEKIGVGKAEREKRNLTFHAWRHFLNTLLLMSDVSNSKVQKVTGHKSLKSQERYTHFDSRQFTEVRAVQAELMGQN